MGGDGILSRDDLFLLMEAYRNNIELSTTLLQQQNQITEQLKKTTMQQEKICTSIDKVANKLDTCTDELHKAHQEMVVEKTRCQAQSSKEHGSIIHRVNLVYVGIGALLVQFLAFVIDVFAKLELIRKIADHLGVG